jgi:hypothetical protein
VRLVYHHVIAIEGGDDSEARIPIGATAVLSVSGDTAEDLVVLTERLVDTAGVAVGVDNGGGGVDKVLAAGKRPG